MKKLLITQIGKKPKEATKKFVVAYSPMTNHWVISDERDDFSKALMLAGHYFLEAKMQAKIYIKTENGYQDIALLEL